MPLSVAGSDASRGSKASSKKSYRTVSKHSVVDDALFGNTSAKKSVADNGSTVISKDLLKKTQRVTPKDVPDSEAVVITASDLARLKQESVIVSREEEHARRQKLEEERANRFAASKARKERMMKMEEERKRNAPLTDIELDNRAANNNLLEKARQALDEELDDVKHMNQMMLYSKCVTIRDAQVHERKEIEVEKTEEEKKLDMMMEIERLKALKVYEEREKKKVHDRRKGAEVIITQIKEREKERIREQELLEQERQHMLKQIDLMKHEDLQTVQVKKEAGRRLLEEVARANADFIRVKKERIEAELEEDQRIAAYIKEKEQREAEYQEELARIAAEKEREVARLRALQEKAADKQAEIDMLRAKRAIEAAERAAREKEKKEMEKLKRINEDLSRAREQQKSEKERRLAEQARLEREEFERIIEVQKQQEEYERLREIEESESRGKHSKEIRAQIASNEELKHQSRRDFLEEGNQIRAKLAAEKRRLEMIKARKIKELQEQEVPDKYVAELARKKIVVG